MVTLSGTASEQEANARADVEESTRFAMRMCQDQSRAVSAVHMRGRDGRGFAAYAKYHG